jgi:hypothetical protein
MEVSDGAVIKKQVELNKKSKTEKFMEASAIGNAFLSLNCVKLYFHETFFSFQS